MTEIAKKKSSGFTLIELIVTVGVFSILAVAFLASAAALSRAVKAAREKTVLASLASQYLEIVRNLPYSKVGTVHGVPSGSLPDFAAPYTSTIGATVYKIYYEVTWIDDPADGTAVAGTDSIPTDYKQVKMDVVNTATNQTTSFVTTVVPQGTEGSDSSGTLWIKVFNAAGQPISGASIAITGISNGVNLSVSSDSSGQWIQYGLPPGVNAYHVIVTKSGYSSDQTYPITAKNPNPTKPDPTIVLSTVTQVSFQIDVAGNLAINTEDSSCQPINGIGVHVVGTKLIGTSPNVLKFDQTATSGPASYPSGQITYSNIEWDTYTPTLSTTSLQSWNIRGTSPIQKVVVLPGTSQTYTVILTPPSPNSLLVVAKDSGTKAPLEGVSLELADASGDDYVGYTSGSVWVQSDWGGGGGFADWSTSSPAVYWAASGGIYIKSGTNDVELLASGGNYNTASTSTLESAAYDTGTSASTFTTLEWEPLSQDASTTLAVQLAANNDDATWNYVGPDGTATTYYTVPGTNINAALNNNRYIRYKVFLSTADSKKTPQLSDIKINYVSGCKTPGQYLFDNIAASNKYTLTATFPGYNTAAVGNINVAGNGTLEVLMSQ